jgi:hypothetical protein
MKYLIATILSVLALTANAQHRYGPNHYHGHRHGGHNWGWVAPALIGGAIVYGVTRPAPLPQPQVVYVPQSLPPAPYGYRYEQILDANCNCYRWVLVQG